MQDAILTMTGIGALGMCCTFFLGGWFERNKFYKSIEKITRQNQIAKTSIFAKDWPYTLINASGERFIQSEDGGSVRILTKEATMSKKKIVNKDEGAENRDDTVYAVTSLSAENIFESKEQAAIEAQKRALAAPGVEFHILQSLNSITAEDGESDTAKDEEAA